MYISQNNIRIHTYAYPHTHNTFPQTYIHTHTHENIHRSEEMRTELEGAGIPTDTKTHKRNLASYSAYTENDQTSMVQSDRNSFNGLIYRDPCNPENPENDYRDGLDTENPRVHVNQVKKEPLVVYSRGIEASGGQLLRDADLPLQRISMNDDLAERDMLLYTRPSRSVFVSVSV